MSNILNKLIDPDDATAGSIDYKSNAPLGDCSGFFVTTYYFRDSDCTACNDFKGQDSPWVKTDIYKTGILQYLGVTNQPEFKGWKLIIYMDQLSLDSPVFKNDTTSPRAVKHKQEWDKIAAHPNVVFGVATWPEYAVGSKGDGKTIDNAILRALRMKAMTDFPTIPVFIRDADTLFENLIKGHDEAVLTDFTKKLGLWEKTLWDNMKTLFAPPNPYRLLIASQPNYHRQWHVHPETGINTTGCYAAITSSLGNIPEMTDNSIWKKSLAYIRQTMNVVQSGSDRNPTNLQKPTYIGKDEQLLSYVMMPAIFDKIYFYYFEYIQVEGGAVALSPDTPFAQKLIDQGITQYPSPYKDSLKEPSDPAAGKRKDENSVTENTLLNPAIIPLSLAELPNRVLKTVFRYYNETIAAAKTAPGYADKQLGGARKHKRSRRGHKKGKRHGLPAARTYKRTYRRR